MTTKKSDCDDSFKMQRAAERSNYRSIHREVDDRLALRSLPTVQPHDLQLVARRCGDSALACDGPGVASELVELLIRVNVIGQHTSGS